ncbi:hypothetical protein [Novipirellula artificiosorum]|uniref:Uncharacterized protein n=1 Tax=Novipirellula artificiosorum TaxID=2528016 RepID=A0A5C6DWQ0_9BACT|nr:hypothetical protein [Novipirellula artificiosorum]TWU41843.1 hypothetical protein Poly41_01350 [Novipirellula artificiosorum]
MTDPRPSTPASSDEPNADSLEQAPRDQGPGWMPAILAATLLMAIVGFITCGVSTWVLFQKRGELAVRTLRGSFIPAIEQSRIAPDEKLGLVDQLGAFADELERGEHENWQAAGVMQRLQRLPVLQWGEIAVIEAFVDDQFEGDAKANALKQLSRLRRSAELTQSTAFDFEDLLGPAHQPDARNPYGRRLIEPLTTEAVAEVVDRARLVADRAAVPDQSFEDIRIDLIVKSEIEKGIAEGTY